MNAFSLSKTAFAEVVIRTIKATVTDTPEVSSLATIADNAYVLHLCLWRCRGWHYRRSLRRSNIF